MHEFRHDGYRTGTGPERGRPGGRRADPFGDGSHRRGAGRGWADFGPVTGRRSGFGGGFPFGPPGFGRGARRGRGDVRAAILALLAEAPMNGYQIITELTERTGGLWRPSPGSVYPTLQALEDQGLVIAGTSEGRRIFNLTDEGRSAAVALGDGPRPWETAARGADRSLLDLRGLVFEVGAAVMQVGRAGSDRQIATVGEILGDTRRRIYLVLADGSTDEPGDQPGGTRSEHEGA